jgi:hypothetical protein
MPLFCKAAAANIKLLNPDFEYLFFDNERIREFIDSTFPEYRSVLDSFRFPIQKYDFFRYLAVYHLGGFYFDLDVFLASGVQGILDYGCVFPFDELTTNVSFIRDYGMDWEIGNFAFGAHAGHPFLHAIIKNCLRAVEDPEWVRPMLRSIPRAFHDQYYILNTTGPGLVSRTLAQFPDASSQVKVLFPEDVCDPDSWHRFGELGVHLQIGAWDRKGFFRSRLRSLWLAWTRRRLLHGNLILGKSRRLEFLQAGAS